MDTERGVLNTGVYWGERGREGGREGRKEGGKEGGKEPHGSCMFILFCNGDRVVVDCGVCHGKLDTMGLTFRLCNMNKSFSLSKPQFSHQENGSDNNHAWIINLQKDYMR